MKCLKLDIFMTSYHAAELSYYCLQKTRPVMITSLNVVNMATVSTCTGNVMVTETALMALMNKIVVSVLVL